MHDFADRPPGTLWVPAFVVEAEGFSPGGARGAPTSRRAEALGSLYKALWARDVSCETIHHTQ
jgi:hypothetical protein